MQQLFIGDISLSEGTIESITFLESEARVEFRTWNGEKALLRFTGMIGSRDRNSAGQEIELLETEDVPSVHAAIQDPFVVELMEERRADRAGSIIRYAFVGSWTMRPILEIYAEEVETQRRPFF